MKVVILAGGFGTRLTEETETKPKPMVEIGGRPILWHIMKHYAFHGFTEFVVALGYRGDVIKRYFLDYPRLNADLTVHLANGDVLRRSSVVDDWTVHLIDTGLHTMTGGRLKRLAGLLSRDTFLMTYGDAVSNVDLGAVVAFHRAHGRAATVTAVRPQARYGSLTLEGDGAGGQVTRFAEKPVTSEAWVNGGYFVLEPRVLDYIPADATHWELEPLERLTAEVDLMAYRHPEFWQSMDTLRDKRYLDRLWESGEAPWKVWP